jgi:rhamnosyl/mannosyltransferase
VQSIFKTNGCSILHIGKFYPPHNGGIETHVRDLAVRQTQIAPVRVIVANDSARSEMSEIDGVRVMRVARLATIASLPVCPTLTGAIRRSPADIVHIHTPNPGAALSFLLSGHTGKLVITHHADTLGRKYLRRLSDPFVVRVMERASRIIVTSSRYLDSSEELAPFREKCRVIPLGIDIQSLPANDPAATQDLHTKFGNRLILAVGRLVPYKGFDLLVRAMRFVDARLLLIGEGPQASSLAALIRAEGVQDKVMMRGRVEHLGPYFDAASIFVLPSLTRAEAFGLVQLEAMAAGVPVVNTDIDSGVPEISVNEKTGLTVAPGNVSELVQAIQLLFDRSDLRKQFSEAARSRVYSNYTADAMASRTMSLYEEILT